LCRDHEKLLEKDKKKEKGGRWKENEEEEKRWEKGLAFFLASSLTLSKYQHLMISLWANKFTSWSKFLGKK
jgi:hypothetical protein